MRRVRARAGCRLDFAGGTLDVWPIGLLHPGARTINVCIDVEVDVTAQREADGYVIETTGESFAAASLAELTEATPVALFAHLLQACAAPPCTLQVSSQSPRGAGLGASSALAVATIAAIDALAGRERSTVDTVHLARDVEAQLMSLPTGCQDHYPAVLGGALAIHHLPGGEEVEALDVDLDSLGEHLIVAYSGQSHVSAQTNWGVFRRRLEGDTETAVLFDRIAEIAQEMTGALVEGNFADVGKLVAEEWQRRRELAEGVSTARLEELLGAAKQAGAYGGKAGGAGGGGCVFFLAPPDRRDRVTAALVSKGAEILDAQPRRQPLTIEL